MQSVQQKGRYRVTSSVLVLLCLAGLQLPYVTAADSEHSSIKLTEGARVNTLAIETVDDSVTEGSEATFRFRRTDSLQPMQIFLELGGTAILGNDYSLEGFTEFSDNRGKLAFAKGQQVAVIAVDIIDDIQAEATETIALKIVDESGNLAGQSRLMISANDTVVTTTADRGEGSLRQALLNADRLEGPDTITFDSVEGPFTEPQTILLESSLPAISGGVTIDGFIPDRLWKASGVTLSGGNERRVMEIAEDGEVVLRNFTIADGQADTGGGLLNKGELVVAGMLFANNSADTAGGGLANSGGSVTVINTTFSTNTAGKQGGGMANFSGESVVTNSTFSENRSAEGAGLFSSGAVRLSNSILSGNEGTSDCQSIGLWDIASKGNLIRTSDGCEGIASRADPRLGKFGRYNGPTMIYPLNGDSPAINLGDNASAVDHEGKPLVWDQRGNGDPRFVGGITDIGAFEHQRNPWLVVDTPGDSGARGCTRMVIGDCSLRGAIELANGAGKPARIRFDDSLVEDGAILLKLASPLPVLVVDIKIDGSNAETIVIETTGDAPLFRCASGVSLEAAAIRLPAKNATGKCDPMQQ